MQVSAASIEAVDHAIRSRRSIRAFLDRPVEKSPDRATRANRMINGFDTGGTDLHDASPCLCGS